MPRKLLRRFLPSAHELRKEGQLRLFGELLHNPNLWHLNRNSVAGAVSIGLFMAFVADSSTRPSAMRIPEGRGRTAGRAGQLSLPSCYSPVLPQVLTALVGGLLIFFILMGILIIGFTSNYSGRIYPGIWVAGINLSGMEPSEAAVLLTEKLDYPRD